MQEAVRVVRGIVLTLSASVVWVGLAFNVPGMGMDDDVGLTLFAVAATVLTVFLYRTLARKFHL